MAFPVRHMHNNSCFILAVKENMALTVLELELLESSSTCYYVISILKLQQNEPRNWRKA